MWNLSMSFYLFTAILLLPISISELFTSITEVGYLLETQEKIINDLQALISWKEEKLLYLKGQYDRFRHEHELAMKDVDDYLGNPINAFTLIKRLTCDLNNIKELVNMGQEIIEFNYEYNETRFPEEEDLVGAAQAITRLQVTYHLDTKELSNGILKGVSVSTPLNADDCYELGRILFDIGHYTRCIEWMKEALNKYYENPNLYVFNDIELMLYLSESHRLLGENNQALKYLGKVLKLDPSHENAHMQLQAITINFEEEEKYNIGEDKKYDDKLSQDDDDYNNKDSDDETVAENEHEFSQTQYEALCRGDLDVPESFKKELSCYFMTKNHPFLRLAPLKIEQAYKDPDIFIFHEVLSDDEIEILKNLSVPKFERAEIVDENSGNYTTADYRINKSAFLFAEESKELETITKRITDMTRLDMKYAEPLHVANYGIGGFYMPHYDFLAIADRINWDDGDHFNNRITTVLFYLADVAQGGATVFPHLGLKVVPRKGTAVVWMNLHPSGEGDLSTLHAACPVLKGSKWIATKWIKQTGQELIQPCNLEYQKESILHSLPELISNDNQ